MVSTSCENVVFLWCCVDRTVMKRRRFELYQLESSSLLVGFFDLLSVASFDGGDKNGNGFQYVEEPLKRIRDGPGFDAKRALSELKIRVSWLLVREVLTGFLRNINEENKTRLRKAPEFHRLLDEMLGHGIFPDFHTFNILLHVNGKTDNPLGALECYEGGRIYNGRTLLRNLWNAGKLSEAHEVIKQMIEKGKYSHLVAKIKGYKGC
ncbi:hypothetical protein D5086_023892 [Populus alba]|uniref:Uncharacterized protein n=1 Tax=Populus alba TaxID=43335 RepID=A0ACC4BBQ6_POPAL